MRPSRLAEFDTIRSTTLAARSRTWRTLLRDLRRTARRDRTVARFANSSSYLFSTGDLFHEDVPPVDLLTRVIRALPWVLVFVGLGAIFVFTAYATSDDGERPTGDDNDRELLVQLVSGGEIIVDTGVEAARAHHAAALAELPVKATRLSKGEPVIPTLFVDDAP